MKMSICSKFILILILFLLPSELLAGSATLSWQRNSEPDLAGYRIYFGTATRTYGPPLFVGRATSYTIENLEEGKTYFFSVTAVDQSGNESGYSQEISKTIDQNISVSSVRRNWHTIYGSVSYGGAPICAMVLANGQHVFTCPEGDSLGKYQFSVPLDTNGEITLFVFASGFAPVKLKKDPSSLETNFEMAPANKSARFPTVTTNIINDNSTPPGWYRLVGTISLDGNPLCAMVLANGQRMFSCNSSNGVFDLTVPLDSNGEITLFVAVDHLQPYKKIIDIN